MRQRIFRHLFTALWAIGCTVVFLWLGYRFDPPTWVLAFFVVVLGDAVRGVAK